MFGHTRLPAGEWRRHSRAQARSASLRIKATVIRESRKALLIDTGLNKAWLPKRLIKFDPVTETFRVPVSLAEGKRIGP